jgi:hypothetical protein
MVKMMHVDSRKTVIVVFMNYMRALIINDLVEMGTLT